MEEGAQGLTVHPRPDQRHIRPQDVLDIADLVAQYSKREFNIEGNPFAAPLGDYPGLLALVEQTQAQQCTLVPDSQAQLTSDHGFDLTQDFERLKPIVQQLKQWNVRISLFMDPDIQQIQLASKLGVDRIELYTGPFAEAFNKQKNYNDSGSLDASYQRYQAAAECAHDLGLGVNAGHDLNLDNMQRFKHLPALLEVSIGHALTVDALHRGMKNTVQAYLQVCN